jgi:hypothetical protein
MSAKWVRSQQWDDQFFPSWAWPAKTVLRAFSSIWLAVLLLSLVAVFGILASVPIGMLALIPTLMVYGLTLLVPLALLAWLPAWGAWAGLKRAGVGLAGRFAVGVLAGLALTTLVSYGWWAWAWPMLRYSETTGEGFRLFAGFVSEYRGLPMRRLPGLEMSELEFYAWWPLEVVLVLFVVNMVTATVRRIEFRFENLGVLTVHTGIVTIALGSAYYATLKQEGDMLLLAGTPDARGVPGPGQPEAGFFDNTETVLWIRQRAEWEQRALRGLPRYNPYGLNAAGELLEAMGGPLPGDDRGRGLSIVVPDAPPMPPGLPPRVDADLRFRVVGYADYAGMATGWSRADAASLGTPGVSGLRAVDLVNTETRAEAGGVESRGPAGGAAAGVSAVRTVYVSPDLPAARVVDFAGALSIEYTRGMDAARWASLQAELPANARHGLVIERPTGRGAPAERLVAAVSVGDVLDFAGYRLEVKDLQPEPPFPIVTSGYQGASSSLAVVRVTPPTAGDAAPVPFERWVYHRFPEIAQDLSDELNERGMPRRKDADAALRIFYVDLTRAQVYLDETGPGTARAIVRLPGRPAAVTDALASGQEITIAPMVNLRVQPGVIAARRTEVPVIIEERERERDNVGNHRRAAIAVEVTQIDPAKPDGPPLFRTVRWLPHAQYLQVAQELHRDVELPDGRSVTLAFGRRYHAFPDMAVQLVDFEMFPYPHSDTPRDFRSDLRVIRGWNSKRFETSDRYTSLNDPLLVRVPFEWNREHPVAANLIGSLLSVVAPNQYKFSQTGWDASGWRQSAARVASGELARPAATFTIIGVGNNPGIYVIAAGSVMMSLGIPWAFYVKPWILRRRKLRIQEALKRGEYVPPGRSQGRAGGGEGGSRGGGSGGGGGGGVEPAGVGAPAGGSADQ